MDRVAIVWLIVKRILGTCEGIAQLLLASILMSARARLGADRFIAVVALLAPGARG